MKTIGEFPIFYIDLIVAIMIVPKRTAPNENELLLNLASGDESALIRIYTLYWKQLFIQAYNVLKDKSACEDIVQDIFFQLWRKRADLHITESLGGYLHAATRYQVFQAIRKSSRKEHLFEHIGERMLTPSADQAVIAKDLQQQINESVSGLPEKCRLIYKLSREELLSHREIAERLHISMKTVENQLTIALRRIRLSIRDGVLLVLMLLH